MSAKDVLLAWASDAAGKRLPVLDLRSEEAFLQRRLLGACNIPLVGSALHLFAPCPKGMGRQRGSKMKEFKLKLRPS